MLQTLPASGHSRQNFYWPIFSHWASTDPVTAAQRAAQLPPGSGHDNAVQVVASTWASQDAQAAFAWANACPRARAATTRCRPSFLLGQTRIRSEASTMIARTAARLRARSRDRRISPGNGRRTIPRPRSPGPRRCRPAKGKIARCKMSSRAGRKAIRMPPPTTWPGCRSGKTQDEAVKSIARQLATADVQTALTWAQKLPEGATRQNALNPIIAQWSETDPASAAEFALRSTRGETRQNLLDSISRQWAQNDPQAAMNWAQSLSDPAARNSVLPNIISGVAENDPARAAQMLSRLSGEAQTSAATAVVSQWAASDPQAAGTLGRFFSRRQNARTGFRKPDQSLGRE